MTLFVNYRRIASNRSQTVPTPTATPTTTVTPIPVASPTQIGNSNWKTYTNTKYGYSFKYPESFELGPSPFVPATTATTFLLKGSDSTRKVSLSIIADAGTQNGCVDVRSCRYTLGEILKRDVSNTNRIIRNIGGFQTEGFTYLLNNSNFEVYFISNKNEAIYQVDIRVTGFTANEKKISLDPVLDQILRTFTFID